MERLIVWAAIDLGRCAMAIAFEINFALWIMIGCVMAEVVQYVGY
jgi:hypothetical protein